MCFMNRCVSLIQRCASYIKTSLCFIHRCVSFIDTCVSLIDRCVWYIKTEMCSIHQSINQSINVWFQIRRLFLCRLSVRRAILYLTSASASHVPVSQDALYVDRVCRHVPVSQDALYVDVSHDAAVCPVSHDALYVDAVCRCRCM